MKLVLLALATAFLASALPATEVVLDQLEVEVGQETPGKTYFLRTHYLSLLAFYMHLLIIDLLRHHYKHYSRWNWYLS